MGIFISFAILPRCNIMWWPHFSLTPQIPENKQKSPVTNIPLFLPIFCPWEEKVKLHKAMLCLLPLHCHHLYVGSAVILLCPLTPVLALLSHPLLGGSRAVGHSARDCRRVELCTAELSRKGKLNRYYQVLKVRNRSTAWPWDERCVDHF